MDDVTSMKGIVPWGGSSQGHEPSRKCDRPDGRTFANGAPKGVSAATVANQRPTALGVLCSRVAPLVFTLQSYLVFVAEYWALGCIRVEHPPGAMTPVHRFTRPGHADRGPVALLLLLGEMRASNKRQRFWRAEM
ncbi:MAG: hypothetical protein U0163_18805 [Gemmatimonadaceae bacterium]